MTWRFTPLAMITLLKWVVDRRGYALPRDEGLSSIILCFARRSAFMAFSLRASINALRTPQPSPRAYELCFISPMQPSVGGGIFSFAGRVVPTSARAR